MKLKELKPKSLGEETLASDLKKNGLHFVQQYKFHPERRWKFDFAMPEHKLAVEIEGGIWSGGRHITPSGFLGDIEKYNAATHLGWYVLRYPTEQVTAGEAIRGVKQFLATNPRLSPQIR